jgi:hypothetical protein
MLNPKMLKGISGRVSSKYKPFRTVTLQKPALVENVGRK